MNEQEMFDRDTVTIEKGVIQLAQQDSLGSSDIEISFENNGIHISEKIVNQRDEEEKIDIRNFTIKENGEVSIVTDKGSQVVTKELRDSFKDKILFHSLKNEKREL
ncbi:MULTISPECIES: hypothetical protein [unclassified Streptococcus]|uniref:hypothetical protein n=1 Tax=unclassified Streptococcus TaxID=2608887 RepID=UPI0010729BB6|nr:MULTISPECIES: hypothetical protein [unclassified Streptococcus]MBF0787080.1 hypothetical protein [Streptococcus sp. 19428wC2_LYSM12]MCQ9211362.1 hypothetical protein [Streptococcus sp. B01]MCQ9214674.1 hypothetical protein [Streptococcus sp. O1]TFV05968.1 hypothetical protein E4T79_04100 [Streptococcus sp. LYSM12]